MARGNFKREPYPFDAGSLGCIEGITITDDSNSKPLCRYFGGLPYALPPLGEYRFRRARPLPEYYRYGSKSNPGHFAGKASMCPQPPMGQTDETLWDEDMLQLNIYIPPGEQPKEGWPVYFYIHGGFLQWGSPNMDPTSVASLLSETVFRAIIVAPAYRLNALGFLVSNELHSEAWRNGETIGNVGFWDQRLALEWTAKNIHFFGGDGDNITVGGYSAGSHSTFQQLAHELYFVPDDKAVIKRAIMWSNSPGIQPKGLDEQQKQFDELLGALHIPLDISAKQKLARLRATSSHDLVAVQDHLKISEFRAFNDGAFISKDIIANINSGDFGRRMKQRGIKLMNGECRDEHFSYQSWRTPAPSYEAVFTRLCGDYPQHIVEQLMDHYCGKSRTIPPGTSDWQALFGIIYANMQVHCLERGFHNALVKGGLEPGNDLLRYRFDWRAKCVDAEYPPEWKVTHATDLPIWFWGLDFGDGLTDKEKQLLKPWNEAFAAFVKGDEVEWGAKSVKEMKRLRSDGQTDVWMDDRWEEGLELWNIVNSVPDKGVISWVKSKI